MRMQDAVVIEYGFHMHDSHLHGFAMQVLDDLNVPASFIGIGPTSKQSVIPKLEVCMYHHLQYLMLAQ